MGKKDVAVGKKVGMHLYLHFSALVDFNKAINIRVEKATELAGLEPEVDFNVIKLNDNGTDLSLLHYPDFFEDAFPLLNQYWSPEGKLYWISISGSLTRPSKGLSCMMGNYHVQFLWGEGPQGP
jgi:hypothetical protein